jgi:hypothetical protein
MNREDVAYDLLTLTDAVLRMWARLWPYLVIAGAVYTALVIDVQIFNLDWHSWWVVWKL